ncbi:hypothetical protein A3840_08835 [Devosia elaeis]|uniref:Uncharacterized protein n=2 Tax=Devosia elaeis TaxID=1770058 RepID=A0A178HXZ1_9HYPH|nr:hypothetical protein A3840_08835 [Devosia elaeis]
MAALGERIEAIDRPKMIIDAIDRARREAVQEKGKCQNATALMYFEGKRAALAEVQAFAEKVAAI